MRTIRRQLLIGLSCATLACTFVAGLALYRQIRGEAGEQSDLQLKQVAAVLPVQLTPELRLPATEDPNENILIQVWGRGGAPLYASQAAPALPLFRGGGYRIVSVEGQDWRVYGVARPDRYVQVSQPVAVRDDYAADMAWRILLPLLVLLPALGGLGYVVVGRALRPLERVARAVAGRSPQDLRPLDGACLPPELGPIVEALNGLLAKIDEAMTAQRNFVADAAHELRSPLTALKLQLQLAERAAGETPRALAFGKLHERLDRATHLVRQLLTLARHEPKQSAPPFVDLDLHRLAQAAVADHSTHADSKAIDLGVEAGGAALWIRGHGEGLAVLLNNLVDNALRYTPSGGRVDVLAGVADGHPFLRVRDNGPGVAECDRPRLFDRFYRPDGNTVWGCGLGLSIVRNVAELHNARILLDENEGGGFMVTVVFPAAVLIAGREKGAA